tara:strand:- start:997 stop:1905 length:909 start_codon:yes stop_codon:yes gene_type:complete
MPLSRSIASIKSAAHADVEESRNIAKELTQQLKLSKELALDTDKLSSARPVNISMNAKFINGKPTISRGKTVLEKQNVKFYQEIEKALLDMNDLNSKYLGNEQRAVTVLSSMGIATPISNSTSTLAPLLRTTTKQRTPGSPLKRIELDESIGNQEFTKRRPTHRSPQATNSRLASLDQRQKQYLNRIAGRMSHLWNTATPGIPNVYSSYRPTLARKYDVRSTAVGKKIINDSRAKLLVTADRSAKKQAQFQQNNIAVDSGPFSITTGTGTDTIIEPSSARIVRRTAPITPIITGGGSGGSSY